MINNAGALIGLGKPSPPEPWQIVRIDPLTGTTTALAELASGSGFSQGQAVHDAAVDHMFLKSGGDALLTIDAATGQLLATTPIVTGMHEGFSDFELVP